MSYNSPFDVLAADKLVFQPSLKYEGTLDAVLSEVALILKNDFTQSANAAVWAFHPPRIIRAVVDYKIEHPTPKIESLLWEAINLALDIYSRPQESSEAVAGLREKIKMMGLEDLLTRPLCQQDDTATANATKPSRSWKTAQRLESTSQFKEVLFIALGHGGVAAGMDVYLKYCDIMDSRRSVFYVARFSRTKCKDPTPRLSDTEVEFLKELADGRQVVVFDEDQATGRTLAVAQQYFDAIFPRVMYLTNLYASSKLSKVLVKEMDYFKKENIFISKYLSWGDESKLISNTKHHLCLDYICLSKMLSSLEPIKPYHSELSPKLIQSFPAGELNNILMGEGSLPSSLVSIKYENVF